MIIQFTPVFSVFRPSLEVSGDVLRVGGVDFDFSSLGDGDVLPKEAVATKWINTDVTRTVGEITVGVILGYIGAAPPREAVYATSGAVSQNGTGGIAPTITPGIDLGQVRASATIAAELRALMVERVKNEAFRRIVAIVPEWKQRNLTAQAAILSEKGRDNWSADELAAWNAGSAIWAQVAAIRLASDVLEAMDPIPADYTDDTYWP